MDCIVCEKAPARRLRWDRYGAALDDQGLFCSHECEAKYSDPNRVHRAGCQCVTCIARIDRERAARSKAAAAA